MKMGRFSRSSREHDGGFVVVIEKLVAQNLNLLFSIEHSQLQKVSP